MRTTPFLAGCCLLMILSLTTLMPFVSNTKESVAPPSIWEKRNLKPAIIDPSTNISHRVYTFWDGSLNAAENELLDLWKISWEKAGWIATVLTIADAKLHPEYDKYRAIFKKYPSINSADYELACWERWIAMVVVGGGVMTDADTINYGFPNTIAVGRLTIHEVEPGVVPAMVSGTADEYQRIVDIFATYNISQFHKHVSDMELLRTMFKRGEMTFNVQDDVIQYGEENWLTHDLIHYSYGSMMWQRGKLTKAQFVKWKRPI